MTGRIELSKHFIRNWERRVGQTPTPERVQRIIDEESVFVQSCENLRQENGAFFRMLAIYWAPEIDILIRVDTYKNKAVSVLTPECLKERWAHGAERREQGQNGRKRLLRLREIPLQNDGQGVPQAATIGPDPVSICQ